MHVHRSNRMERLASALAEVVGAPAPGAGPFDPEPVVVQGRGMERWLSMELARRLGIWANPAFPFPRAFLEEAFAAALGEGPPGSRPWSPEAAAWSIAALLPTLLEREALAPIRRYLGDGPDDALRRLALADRIGRVFDQYVVYRPRMILQWERGQDGELPKGQRWQPLLWRALGERDGWVHVGHRAKAFLEALGRGDPIPGRLPPRVSLFGMSALPPLYLELFGALSRRTEVHLFVLSPSQMYWADVRSKRQQLRERRRARGVSELTDEDLHYDEGHPLLASMGKLGRDFQKVLESVDDYTELDRDLHERPAGATMLERLQRDMLELRAADPLEVREPAPEDESIRVHACHGPMREMEVLRDQLLDLLARDETLDPQDIVVMTPDIEAYAPVIQAVFERPRHDPTRLPFHVADRGVRATHPVVDAFEDLLDLVSGRMPASAVLDVLGATAVRERFGIGSDELDTIRRWVVESGIRWGVDAAHRAEEGQPAETQNTWRFGLDRLLVGWAVDSTDDRVCAGVLPYDDVEGSAGDLLGRLVGFCDALFELRQAVRGAHPVGWWRERLSAALDRLLAATAETASEHQLVRRALAELAARAEAAGFDEPVELRVLRQPLSDAMTRDLPVRSFLAGGITFCQLVPMRSIPFRVVCLVGMSDEAFPRGHRPMGFDLTARAPRLGDRTPRDEDRYLFVEALLSARERLVVTYVGQSIHDNALLPPSVLVSELLDALAETVPPARRDELRARLVVRHPLSPWSPRYFEAGGDGRLFSYAPGHAAGARSLLSRRDERLPFLTAPLPEERGPGEPVEVTLDELERFVKSPVASFLQRRLGLYVGEDTQAVPDREPIELDALARWQIGDRILSRRLAQADVGRSMTAIQRSGVLPLGTPGAVLYDDIEPVALEVAQQAEELFPQGPIAPRAFTFDADGVRLTGVLRNLRPEGQLDVSYSRLGRRSELVLWVRHLVIGAVAPEVAQRSVLVGRADGRHGAEAVWLRPVEGSRQLLGRLLALWRLGQSVPLLWFEHASRAFAAKVRDGDEGPLAWAAARRAYHHGTPCDANDPHVRQVFGDVDPVEPGFDPFAGTVRGYPSFEALALDVYGPFLAHRASEDGEEGP